MKILDKAVIILISIALIIAAGVGPAIVLASSEDYYHRQFAKNGIYSETNEDGSIVINPIGYINGDPELCGYFTDSQLDAIVSHIVNFIFGNGESFEMYMDGVNVNGISKDNVRVFGDDAIAHMDDVKGVMRLGKILSIVSLILLPFLVAYVIWRRKECSPALIPCTLALFGALLLLLLVMCVISIAMRGDFVSNFWIVAHYLFFPFQPDKVEGSLFNDTLTMVLTLELFIDAVIIVLSTLGTALMAWLGGIFLLRRGSLCTLSGKDTERRSFFRLNNKP